ncbi:MAG: regulatory protein RecX [bacterium]
MDKKKIIDFALKLLAIRDYGEAELRLRMEAKGYTEADISPVMDSLKQKNFINDAVYISKLISKYTIKAPSSKAFIKNYLELKGLKKEQFELLLEVIDERTTARKAFQLKFKPIKKSENTMKLRQKATNYLQAKGFDYDIIIEILNEELKGDLDYE